MTRSVSAQPARHGGSSPLRCGTRLATLLIAGLALIAAESVLAAHGGGRGGARSSGGSRVAAAPAGRSYRGVAPAGVAPWQGSYGWYGNHGWHHGAYRAVYFGGAWGFYPYDGYPWYDDPFYLPGRYPALPGADTAWMERPDLEAAEAASPHWYYCYEPAGYYPDVTDCPAGWVPVAPLPAALTAPPAGTAAPVPEAPSPSR